MQLFLCIYQCSRTVHCPLASLPSSLVVKWLFSSKENATCRQQANRAFGSPHDTSQINERYLINNTAILKALYYISYKHQRSTEQKLFVWGF
jgi:hypothetical protein